MSLAKTMKELETANQALESQLVALQAEASKTTDAHAAALRDLQAQLTARDATVADLTGKLEAATQAAQAAAQEAAKARTGLEAQVAQLTGDLAKARAALANPAFADAAAPGQPNPPKDGGESAPALSDAQFEAAYRAETNPEKRAQMWRDRTK